MAARWRLRAEEYRTIGEALMTDIGQRTYEDLAKSYERIARQKDSGEFELTTAQCRAMATECRDIMRRFSSPRTKELLRKIAERWDWFADRPSIAPVRRS